MSEVGVQHKHPLSLFASGGNKRLMKSPFFLIGVSMCATVGAFGQQTDTVELPFKAASTMSLGNSRSISTAFPESNYPWKRQIVTTVFWIGERPTANNPVPNDKSSWDVEWVRNYGGYDNPDPRARSESDYTPVAISAPKQNPFYIALPYNDVARHGTKPEAGLVIPWFRTAFEKTGKSVCKGRWIAIRRNGKVCYAQWEDVGPYRTDHWQYVFGNERPTANRNQGAGLDVSPAIRDFLGFGGGKSVTDWRFVEFYEVPDGPWREHGENNIYVTHKELAEKIQGAYVRSRARMNH